MKLNLAISPCPNDTFIFDALVNQRIAPGPLHFTLHLADVQQLNLDAIQGIPDVSKVSTGVIPVISEEYQILDAGAALGRACGPLLISREGKLPSEEDQHRFVVAVPGEHTTAHQLLALAFPGMSQKRFMLFSEIENAVLNGSVDAGLIIHESRFTYQAKGLKLLADMGDYWENTYHFPLPLGCIVIRRSLPEVLKLEVQGLIRQSVEYAFSHPTDSQEFVTRHAQEMDPYVMQQHIDLYVNNYSVSLGQAGVRAIRSLLKSIPAGEKSREIKEPLFV